MHNYFITSDFSRELGGAAKTIGAFRQALGGTIVGFNVHGQNTDCEDSLTIPVGSGILGRYYGYSRQRQELEQHFARHRDTAFFSAHLLFRYHCQWVQQNARKWNRPYWVVPHGALDPWVFTYNAIQKKVWMDWKGRPFLQNANAVIFSTEREREKAAHIVDLKNSHVIHWPVEPIDMTESEIRRQRWRQELGICKDARVLLYLGRYTKMKRPLETIQYFAESKPSIDEHLVLVGNESGISIPQLKQAVPSPLAKQIHVLGPKWGQERDDAILGSDGFVSLSFRENFGHTVAEAMSAGLPVVLSPGNDLIGDFPDSPVGICLKSDEKEEAVVAIRDFLDLDPDRSGQWGETGKDWVRNTLGPEVFRQRLTALHQSITESCSGPPR